MPGQASISGVISGLNTDDIISKIMDIAKRPLTNLQTQQAVLKNKLAAWQNANTRVLALKMTTDNLANAATFDAKTVTSSDSAIITGKASVGAAAGTYIIKVNSLARQHQVTTQGYADTNSARIGTGSIDLQIGANAPTTIKIDDSNNTLAGLRDAINNAGIGATASIVNDGSGASPYRLLLTSNTTGAAGQITLTPYLTGGTAPTVTTIQPPQQASISLGDGDGALTIKSDSNTMSDVIPGLTLNLLKADTTNPETITIATDTTAIKASISNFVDQYNNLMTFMNSQFEYNPDTGETGTLFTDSTLQSLQESMRSMISQIPEGVTGSIKLLSQIGVTSGTDDTLSLDSTALDKALSTNLADVRKLFGVVGTASSSAVTYLSSTDDTKASSTGYAVEVTQAATKSRLTAGVQQTQALASDERLTVNDVSIVLTSGMTQSQVIAKINQYSSQTGVTASATDSSGSGTGNYLTLTATAYGSGRNITVGSNVSNGGAAPVDGTSGLGNAAISVLSPAGESLLGTGALGKDIAGTINGEAATGVGQILTGNAGNAKTAGLKLLIDAATTGSYGTLSFTKGIGDAFSRFIASITDATTGAMTTAQSSIKDSITDFDANIADMQSMLNDKQESLQEQFAAMESALGQLQDQGSYLTSQAATLSKNWKTV